MKFAKYIYYTLCILFVAWVVLSIAEISVKSLNPNPVYNPANFFEIIL